jgi:hypothetical protein
VTIDQLNRRLFQHPSRLEPQEAAKLVCAWIFYRATVGDAELERRYAEHAQYRCDVDAATCIGPKVLRRQAAFRATAVSSVRHGGREPEILSFADLRPQADPPARLVCAIPRAQPLHLVPQQEN